MSKQVSQCPRCKNDTKGDWIYECKNANVHLEKGKGDDRRGIITFCTICRGGPGNLWGGLACPICGENTNSVGIIK